MGNITITKDDFRRAVADALITWNKTSTDVKADPVTGMMLTLANTAFASLIEKNLFEMKTKENR